MGFYAVSTDRFKRKQDPHSATPTTKNMEHLWLPLAGRGCEHGKSHHLGKSLLNLFGKIKTSGVQEISYC